MFSGGWVLIKVIMFLQHLPRASTLNDHYQINISTNDLFCDYCSREQTGQKYIT